MFFPAQKAPGPPAPVHIRQQDLDVALRQQFPPERREVVRSVWRRAEIAEDFQLDPLELQMFERDRLAHFDAAFGGFLNGLAVILSTCSQTCSSGPSAISEISAGSLL